MISVRRTTQADAMLRPLCIAIGLNLIWINLSEVFRYFVFVMPMMREALPMVPGVAPMNLPVFLVWGVWDTILVLATSFLSWLVLEKFGAQISIALAAGTVIWATVFVIFWLGLFNMNLAPISVIGIALTLAWIEMVIAALVVRWSMLRYAS